MSFPANLFSPSKAHRSATPVVIGSSRPVPEGWLSMRVSGRSSFSLSAFTCGFLSGAQPNSAAQSRHAPVAALIRLASVQSQRRSRAQPSAVAQFRPAFVRASFRLASAQVQLLAASPVARVTQAFSRHPRPFSTVPVSRFVLQRYAGKPVAFSTQRPNPSLNRTVVKPALFLIRRCAAGYLKR